MKVTQDYYLTIEPQTIVKKDDALEPKIVLLGESSHVTLKFSKKSLQQITEILNHLAAIKKELLDQYLTELEAVKRYLPQPPSLPQLNGKGNQNGQNKGFS